MDSAEEEDVSARVLLRNVLHTEAPRSPVTRSASRDQRLSLVRRSSRLQRNTSETPQVALRRKLKQTLHETATRSQLPPGKRARTLKTPAAFPSPSLYGDDITPRGLLRGIIQTEAEASLLLSGQTAVPPEDRQDTEAGIHGDRRSDGLSALELPDLATEPLTHVIRGMSRRRPPPTFNVSAFEKRLEPPSGEEEEEEEEMDVPQENPDVSKEQDLSAGSKSLTLKTPFVNLRPERAGLRRKAAGRRTRVSVDTFDEAVEKRLERRQNQDYTVVPDGRTLQDSDWHKFTLGLSDVTMPEISTDVMMSNTELYAQPQAFESELRDADGGLAAAEMKRGDDDDDDGGDDDDDVGERLQDVVQDHPIMYEGNISERQPDPSQAPELDPQSQDDEDEDEVEMIPPSQEKEGVSLCPEDIPLAPTQAMVDRVSQPQEQEENESAMQEAQVEEVDLVEVSHQEAEPSHALRGITRRAYHSEGGAIRNDAMARGRGTKSLGMGQDPAEKPEQSSEIHSFSGGDELGEMVSVEEEPHGGAASSSAVRATKPSETHQDSLVRTAEEQDVVQDLSQSESEEVEASDRVSPTVDFPAAEEEVEEEEEQQEVQEEAQEQQQEEELEEEQEEELEEDEDAQSEELSMQTPGFIRQRKQVSTPGALATPTILKALNAGPAPKAVKPRPTRKPGRASAGVLPKSYVMSVFKHFAKTKVASDVYPVISDILQRYFDRLADDLEAYSAHARRKTIEVEDVELLMRRQGFVTDITPVNVLIEKFLPLEYRKLLIPVATSGNKVVPDQRR